MNIKLLNEYFLKSKEFNKDLSICNKTIKYESEIGCDNPKTKFKIGFLIPEKQYIKEIRINLEFANIFVCAYLYKLKEIIEGQYIYHLDKKKILEYILGFFKISKKTEELKAIEFVLDKLV